MTIRICLKIETSGFQQKCISGDFPQLLELPQLRTHIGGCFQSVREAAIGRIFSKYLGKRTWRNPFKVKLCKNPKRVIFQIALCVSLFHLVEGLVLFFFKDIKNEILIIITYSTAKTYVILIFSSWFTSSLFETNLSTHRSSRPAVLRKRCSENMQQI